MPIKHLDIGLTMFFYSSFNHLIGEKNRSESRRIYISRIIRECNLFSFKHKYVDTNTNNR
jgi:hypothetical protein